MAERLRPVQMKFYVTEEERNFIYKKMSLIGVKNLSAYLRKMAIDGQLVRIETTDLDEICRQISGIAKNINQIAKRINATDNIFLEDIREMKKKVEEAECFGVHIKCYSTLQCFCKSPNNNERIPDITVRPI